MQTDEQKYKHLTPLEFDQRVPDSRAVIPVPHIEVTTSEYVEPRQFSEMERRYFQYLAQNGRTGITQTPVVIFDKDAVLLIAKIAGVAGIVVVGYFFTKIVIFVLIVVVIAALFNMCGNGGRSNIDDEYDYTPPSSSGSTFQQNSRGDNNRQYVFNNCNNIKIEK